MCSPTTVASPSCVLTDQMGMSLTASRTSRRTALASVAASERQIRKRGYGLHPGKRCEALVELQMQANPRCALILVETHREHQQVVLSEARVHLLKLAEAFEQQAGGHQYDHAQGDL